MLTDQVLDIRRLEAAYAAGLTPQALVDECYRRIAALDDPGIFLYLRELDQVQADVAQLGPFDPRSKPLWGVPFAIKDNIDAKGLPTSAACAAFTYTAEADAFVVERLRRAGALLIGKTNLDQFATGLVGVRTPGPAPRNALDPSLVPGGSSSGSAVAVAQGLVSFALGTDTAGSGRVPAALNNIVGLKPTLGALSNTGVVPACRTLDSVSVFALTVDDAYAAFTAAGGFDAADPFARPIAIPALSASPPRFRVGVPATDSLEFFGDETQRAAFTEALAEVRASGGELIELDFGVLYEVAAMLYEGAWVAERYTVVEALLRDQPEALHPVTRQIVAGGAALSAADVFRGIYRLQALKRRAAGLLAQVDLLCVPTIPTIYSLADLEADPLTPNARLGTYTNFVNLLDLCGIAIPVGQRRDARPGAGITLLAKAGRDAELAAIAIRIQASGGLPLGATGWTLPEVEPPATAAGDDEIEIAVVGAHMSGLPLNGELSNRGGRFLRVDKTAAHYRLYRLAGGPPFRPGLIESDRGAAIDLEVWSLPLSRFGEFLRGVPKPLCIGTLTLADGAAVKGFLCEPSGIQGASDITAHGGWRNYFASLNSTANSTEVSDHAKT